MRRIVSVALPLAILFLSAIPTLAQERSAEMQALDVFVGEWADVEAPDEVIQVCSWLGNSFVQCPGTWTNSDGNVVTSVFLLGYDTEEEVYIGFRFYGGGYHDSAKLWVDGNTWTWLFEDNGATRLRSTAVFESPNAYSYEWARSVEGGDWVNSSSGGAVKVR
jgi:hypothetical protein